MRNAYGNPISKTEQVTQRALRVARRKPVDADAPPLSTFPGRPHKPLPGQLDLTGKEHRP